MVAFAHALRSIQSELPEIRGRDIRPAKVAGGGGTVADGFPPGTGSCPCECFEGVELPDADPEADVCCYGHPLRTIVQPWFDAPYQGELELKYIGGGVWATDAWDGPSCEVADVTVNNTFQYVVTPSATAGASLLELVVVDDNDCPVPCLQYLCEKPYQCNCVNVFERATFDGIDSSRFACKVCDKPAFEPLRTGCGGELVSHTGISDFVVTVDTDEYCVHGPYDGGTETIGSGLGATTMHKCVWTGQAVSGQYGMLIYTRWGSAPTVVYTWNFVLCDEPFAKPEGSPFYGCPPDGWVQSWGAAGGAGGLVDGVGTYTNSVSTPTDITVAEADSECAPFSPGAASRDGSCAGCTAGTAPTNAAGHCCYRGACYEWSESLCNDFGGAWHAGTDCTAGECGDQGACCDNGVCVQTSLYACYIIGGSYTSGGNCNTAGLCDVGACCETDGSCTDKTESDCTADGGFWNGAGVDCGDVVCTLLWCCYPNGPTTCVQAQISKAECDSYLPHSEQNLIMQPDCGDGAISGQQEPDGDCIFF